MRRPLGIFLLIVLVTAGLTPGVAGQETYRLDDDDTWRREATPDPETPAGQLARIRRALAAGEYERAEFLATQFIDRQGDDARLPEAYLLRGDALRARRKYYDALFDYEFVAQAFPGSDVFVRALERELEIARIYARGTKRTLWGLRIIDASDEAEELLIRVQERLPGSRLAEEAGMELGDFYFARRDMDMAAEMYSLFIENFPRSPQLTKARRRLIYAHIASFKGPEFDAAGLYDARTRIKTLQATDPAAAQQMGADALLTRIDESDASKMLETAKWYLKTNDPIAAEFTLRGLIQRYPGSVAARQALRGIPAVLEQLPPAVLAEAPDYETLRAAILGSITGRDPVEPVAPVTLEAAP